jgi:ABC-2 type transport system permease protein
MYGESFIKRFKRTAMADYLNGRSGDTLGEVSLHKLINQRYLRYKKGAVVFLSLAELMGEANINRALANLMKKKVGDHQNPATSLDLIRHIKQMSQPAHCGQIDDWFKSVVVFNNKI